MFKPRLKLSLEHEMNEYADYLAREIMTRNERSAILLSMAIAAYDVWSRNKEGERSFIALDLVEKEMWITAMKAAIRVMFGLDERKPREFNNYGQLVE